jgi:hypothetical protein
METPINWARWFLDVEKYPFRILGAVAAVFAFAGTALVLIVSKVV